MCKDNITKQKPLKAKEGLAFERALFWLIKTDFNRRRIIAKLKLLFYKKKRKKRLVQTLYYYEACPYEVPGYFLFCDRFFMWKLSGSASSLLT